MSKIIAELHARLVRANDAYRNGNAIMSDAAYDTLEAELKALVEGDASADAVLAKAFLSSIGAAPPDNSPFNKVIHEVGMTSLNKAVNEDELRQWWDKCDRASGQVLVWSEKMDGLSIDLKYVDGVLVRATTRGDGTVGQDITRNVLRMKGVKPLFEIDIQPLTGMKVPFNGHVRGEIIMLTADFEQHYPNESNPRNSANGKATTEDGTGCEHCSIVHYSLIGTSLKTKFDCLEMLRENGFKTPNYGRGSVKSIGEVCEVYQRYIARDRAALPYEIDGLVVEFDDLAAMEELGDLNKRPKGAVALKFPSDAKETTLRDVVWQVGKSGRITPVAIFDPVSLAGAKVERASLHNVDNIADLWGRIDRQLPSKGDRILVARRNDVIPYVEEIIEPSDSTEKFEKPSSCPSCDVPVHMQGAYLVCFNWEDCPGQVVGAISRWVKKIGVIGVGDAFIEAVVEHAGVESAADLYKLKPEDIRDIHVGGSKLGRSADLALEALHKIKSLPLHVFIGALGIPLCARSVCKTVVDAGYDSLDKMERATVADIAAIPGLGQTKAESFVKGLFEKMPLIDALQDVGIEIQAKAVGALTGKSFCFTGFRDPSLEKAIEAAGGSMKSSVGSGLSFLVVRDTTSTSGKATKAKSLGVDVIGIEDAKKLAGLC